MITLFNFAWIRIEKGAGGNSVTCQVIMEFTLALFFYSFFIQALTIIETVYFARKECWLVSLNSGMSAGDRIYE